ncbi:peptidase U32 [Leptolyngbya sp. BL0902]|uniref:U32 family peptidase n=1 Tax=Leptolyngbya sp. BL0902 TaxID=1115757 RepID=UPI0018E7DC84|nr:U32 family peptidase [Leptolyngbya sp. BL0902]QQE65396.1 peptidase U32 [Leptolyngbya sp. BL0902]
MSLSLPTDPASSPASQTGLIPDNIPTPERSEIPLKRPELLAPAGQWDCAKAAVENGADAIYFGLDRFNARMRAENFTEADLPDLMAFLHRRGVKGYVTLNTLVFPAELAEAEQYLKTIIAAGVDAVIVQDVGLCRLIRHLSPDFPIHASTQMTVTSAAGVAFAKELGCQLVVLARECSIKDIQSIQDHLRDQAIAMPLEVFVHGALCVAYSGQCLTSEALGGRSANRGECAQACRMAYDLVADGETVDLGDRQYLLSPQDLSGLDVLPALGEVGVHCLKIEGRLKTPEYVANVTRIYRRAIDAAFSSITNEFQQGSIQLDRGQETEGRAAKAGDPPKSPLVRGTLNQPHSPLTKGGRGDLAQADAEDRYQLEMAFSRGLYTGWFEGIDNQALVHGRFGKKRGVYLGRVSRIAGGRVFLTPEAPLKAGDGVVFDQGKPAAQEEGGRIYQVIPKGEEVALEFGRQAVNFNRIRVGDWLWKTSDPALDKELRQTYAGDTPKFQRPIAVTVQGEVDHPLVLTAQDEVGHIAQVESAMPLVAAETNPLTTERLEQQLGRLGNTPFRLGSLDNRLSGSVMLPVSELNRLRRAIVETLDAQRAQPRRWQLSPQAKLTDLLPTPDALGTGEPRPYPTPDSRLPIPDSPTLTVLVRTQAQLEAVLESGIDTIYCEWENPATYRATVQWFRANRRHKNQTLWVAPPRITKPRETYILEQVKRSEADGYLVRNYDHLAYFADQRCVGDFSLNVANALTADYFIQRYGMERVTASYDLNADQLGDLLQSAPPQWFEITLHQHMPMFHMEHCVFCAFLSDGKDFRDCGRPCESHGVKLRDRVGTEHILQADAGCRNTLFNGVAQTGAEYAQRLISLGAHTLRLEFLNETPAQVSRTIQQYQQLLDGHITGTQLWRSLKLESKLGVTRGPMDSGSSPSRKGGKSGR